MVYSSLSQVEFFSQAKNHFTYDTSSTSVTAQNLLDENNYTTSNISLVNMEKLIDNAVNYVNLNAGTSIAAMAGVAGAKTLTCTRSEADTVKIFAALLQRVYLKTGSTNVGIGGLSVNTVTNDSSYSILFDQSSKAFASLKAAQLFNDVTFSYAGAVAKYIVVADSQIDAYCGVPSGFFNAGGYTVTDEYHDGAEVQRSSLSVPYTSTYLTSSTQNRSYILKTKLYPILSVTSLSEETSNGSWTARTENTDFIIIRDGVRFLANIPAAGFRNIKITYTAGYSAVPAAVANVSAQLAAEILNTVIQQNSTAQTQEAKKQ